MSTAASAIHEPAADQATRTRVLFVDDEHTALEALRMRLHPELERWDATFVGSGAEALAHLEKYPVDVVMTDMHMPEMSGATLLSTVRERWPATGRIVLSTEADYESVLSAARWAHQFLATTAAAPALTRAVDRALAVQRILTDPDLRARMGGVDALPTLPAVYHRLVEATESAEVDIAQVVQIIAEDIATSAAVLRLVNSSFFGLPRHVATVESAVMLLGLENIQALVLTSAVFTPDSPVAKVLDIEALRERALRRSAIARVIAVAEGLTPTECHIGVLAGMMRDVGALVLAVQMPAESAALAQRIATEQAAAEQLDEDGEPGEVSPLQIAALETEVFGCTITAASAYLMALWCFPPAVMQVLATQPLSDPSTFTTPLEYVLDFAHRRALAPLSHVRSQGDNDYLTPERLTAWNAAADALRSQ